MKKKIFAGITLLLGIMLGFTGIKIIDHICKKNPEDALKPLKNQVKNVKNGYIKKTLKN